MTGKKPIVEQPIDNTSKQTLNQIKELYYKLIPYNGHDGFTTKQISQILPELGKIYIRKQVDSGTVIESKGSGLISLQDVILLALTKKYHINNPKKLKELKKAIKRALATP